MIVWSRPVLRSGLMSQLRKDCSSSKFKNALNYQDLNQIQVRTCKGIGGHFNIVPSSFTWNKTKDMVKFYLTLTSIPFIAILLYANIFIGPATLKPIPEGYEPKYWEYHQHPVSRFLCRYLTEDPQKTYEKMCFTWYYYAEKEILRKIEKKVKSLIASRRDFQAWYYTPGYVKYSRDRVKKHQDLEENNIHVTGFPLY